MYVYKEELALNNLQGLICHKTLPNQIIYIWFVQAFKIVVDSWKLVCYYYTSYEMTEQFLWFQLQTNSYSSNWNTPY